MKALTKRLEGGITLNKFSKKYEILLLTHGGWGETLRRTLEMIVGPIDGVKEVALEKKDTPETFYNKVEIEVKKMPNNSLIITDIVGGTTSNVALMVSRNYKIHILSGLSSIMLIEAVTRQNETLTEEAIDEIKTAALMNCQCLELPQK